MIWSSCSSTCFRTLATPCRPAGCFRFKHCALGDMVEVVIQDTGSGIAPAHLSQIEEPFFTTKHNGSGLGLSICRSIIWEIQGDLKISSQEGVGTEVRVLLPMLEPAGAGVGR